MSKYAVVDSAGVVVNIIVAAPGFEIPGMSLVEAAEGAAIGGTYANGVFTPPEPVPEPAPNSDQVDVERDRRIEETFSFGGESYQLDEKSISRIIAMGADARFAILGGAPAGYLRWADPNNDFGWIATDNSVTPMDAQTMVAFADSAKLWVSQHIFSARSLKDENPIPSDYKDDKWWP